MRFYEISKEYLKIQEFYFVSFREIEPSLVNLERIISNNTKLLTGEIINKIIHFIKNKLLQTSFFVDISF